MDISFLGHASFEISSKEGVIVTDPFDPAKVGLPFPKVSADLVLVSHDHFDHNHLEGVGGDPFVISGPGEYEVKGVKVRGFRTFHDSKEGKERGKNTVYLFEAEGITVCHLGDLGHPLSEGVVEEIGDLDILLIPVGGFFTIGPSEAAKVVAQLSPKLTIPMHYRTEGMDKSFSELETVSAFLEEMGVERAEPQDKLKVSRKTLPEEPKVVVLTTS
ncbi:MAG: MBL fold metallo-hydrolase [Patescibacteria group bacterium]|nr:MAG: MBL fold metallo-hydrolase [Patescibacteria group bacterium]